MAKEKLQKKYYVRKILRNPDANQVFLSIGKVLKDFNLKWRAVRIIVDEVSDKELKVTMVKVR